MSKKEEAVNNFLGGLNCAQSVLSGFCADLGLDRSQAIKMASGLGAGFNYAGNTCGAVTGAYLVLGLKFGVTKTDPDNKQLVRNKIDAFNTEFKKHFGSIDCRGLLKADVSIPEELEKLRAQNTFHSKCPGFIERSVAILEELIENQPNSI